MSFDLKSLQPLGASGRIGITADDPGNNARGAWIYASADDQATIITDGYFNEARDILEKNDIVLVASSGKNLRWTRVLDAEDSPAVDNVKLNSEGLNAA